MLDFGPDQVQLGSGASCIVLKAKYIATEVAVKQFTHNRTENDIALFKQECSVLKYVNFALFLTHYTLHTVHIHP